MLLKNTWLFAKQHGALFVLLILTQLAAIVGILLSYGIVLNNQYNLKAAERDFHSFRITFKEETRANATILAVNAFPEILNGYEDTFQRGCVYVSAPWELENTGLDEMKKGWIQVCCVFGYDGEAYTADDDASKWNRKCIEGEWFTDDAYNAGLRQCVVDKQIYRCEQEGLMLGTTYYEIIGHEREHEIAALTSPVFIPFESISTGMQIEKIVLLFTRPLTTTEYSELYSRMVEVFGPLPEYKDKCSLDIDEKATMHTMIINSILIALLASFTVCLLYRYLLEKRKVMTAVYEICGCTGWRAAGLYIGEMLLLFACTAVGGMSVFWYVIKPYMEKSFPWFSAIYKGETAFRLIGVYAVVVLVVVTVMICGVTKKQPKEILREG